MGTGLKFITDCQPVGAENSVTSCDLHILMNEAGRRPTRPDRNRPRRPCARTWPPAAVLAAMEATLAAHGFDFSHISDDELLAEVTRRLRQSPAPADAPATDSSSG